MKDKIRKNYLLSGLIEFSNHMFARIEDNQIRI